MQYLTFVYTFVSLLSLAACVVNITNFDKINWLEAKAGNQFYVQDDKILVEIVNVEENIPSNTTLGKRAICPSRTATFTQYQMVQQGTWWSAWQLASGWQYCNLDSTPGSQLTFDESWTSGYSINNDIGISIGEIITLAFGLGVSLEQSVSKSEGSTCSCSGSDPVCVWEQSKMNWSDSQKQTCTLYSDCNGSNTYCGAWSAYQRTNAPYKSDPQSINFGCSSGVSNCTPN